MTPQDKSSNSNNILQSMAASIQAESTPAIRFNWQVGYSANGN
jgi:hypothetical protein